MKKTKGTIFINYRKDDSNWNAVALYQELQKYFSKDQIFKDFNAISPGDDFVESINRALISCDVLLVLIGKSWLQIKGDDGTRRLEDLNDFVRLEIAKALDRNIKVVPVLLDRTPMPRVEDLPESLHALCRRQFVEIDPTRFEDDVRNLAEAIRNAMTVHIDPEPEPVRPEPVQPDPVRPEPPKAPKPDNNLVLGILTTVVCCMPLGILCIIQSNKVDSLYAGGNYVEAQQAADMAKKYAIWAAIVGFVSWLVVTVFYLILAAASGGY